jgi:hypothetical protein
VVGDEGVIYNPQGYDETIYAWGIGDATNN